MSLGSAYRGFSNFLEQIVKTFGNISLPVQLFQGVGSLFPKTPDFPLPDAVQDYVKTDPVPGNLTSVTQGTTPQLGPNREGKVVSEGGFFRDPNQLGATAMGAAQYAEGGEAEQDPEFLAALERQRLREQAFDNEFAIEVAAQSNYAADIDPSISRYHGLPNAAPGIINYDGLRGFYLRPNKEYPEGTFADDYPKHVFYKSKDDTTDVLTIIPEFGMVNTIDKDATPQVLAHEYRHRQFPQLNERQIRVADFLTALDERQVVNTLRSQSSKEKGPLTGSEALDDFRYALRFERDNPGQGVGAQIFGEEWDRGARSTRQGTHEYKDQYIRARVEESPAIKLLNEYEDLIEYNEKLPEQNEKRREEAAVRGYANGGIAGLVPVARNMFNVSDIKRGVGAYVPYVRR